ncbi:homoserine kinase [Sporosarcina sp. P37]|uniref:homoserine kinase n=1 Tax=unclassified Sporosarcina TaxID=2647733 RepID=UPI0009BDAB07|nr:MULTISPECIES: homoserine kinase [unclassified Sporosarcina]ARD48413.1 homoserine kinase [Sporosarcina sp. P33]ARK24917.1 homoserine kinase [Sporosarcina sp. P37]PID17128.1 homoserine kinase [Sporosarcina sp. P35]
MLEAGFTVTVPATTANLGPGFDHLGLALSLTMSIEVAPADQWYVLYQDKEYAALPTDETNLIVQTIQQVAARYDQQVSPQKLAVRSDIPLGKGLGSSATAIAAGIEIASELTGLQLSPKDKLRIGSELEGHADNVTAALIGGMTVSYFTEDEMEVLTFPAPPIGIVILVPPVALKTEASRGLLPEQLAHKDAVRGSAAGSVMTAAIAQADWVTAGRMMERDLYHEPYRKVGFPNFDEIRIACKEAGAYGMTISGAGPSLFIAVPPETEQQVAASLNQRFPHYQALALQPAETGAFITK